MTRLKKILTQGTVGIVILATGWACQYAPAGFKMIAEWVNPPAKVASPPAKAYIESIDDYRQWDKDVGNTIVNKVTGRIIRLPDDEKLPPVILDPAKPNFKPTLKKHDNELIRVAVTACIAKLDEEATARDARDVQALSATGYEHNTTYTEPQAPPRKPRKAEQLPPPAIDP